MSERKRIEMTEHELNQVHGGYKWYEENGRYYKFVGDENKDKDRKYVCPICGRRLHYGKAWRYYCDDCDKSWFMEWHLPPNRNSGVWQEISREEYYGNYYD